jgi:protein-L-isoaspartate(D-aspartate) O-methyltransferase
MSQPWIVACMAQLLDLDGSETVLEVGTGSGYGAAVLSRLSRKVVTIERYESLAVQAEQVLHDLGYDNVVVGVGDGSRGAPEHAPFGGISVTATARDRPPDALFEQLGPGAALVCPVDREGRELLMRFRDGEEEPITGVRFVPLVSEDEP